MIPSASLSFGTNATPRATLASTDFPVTSSPQTRTSPEAMGRSP